MNVSSAATIPHTPRCLTGAPMVCPERYALQGGIDWHDIYYTREDALSGSVTIHLTLQIGTSLLRGQINYNAIDALHRSKGMHR